jgi:hypothetical protein
LSQLVQAFLRSNGLEAISAPPYYIKTSRSLAHPELVLFNYNQINSPMGDPLVQRCRGLILDESRGWRTVAYPYDKFFNHGEGHAAPIDWSTARVMEKLDGTLCTLYWHAGKWNVSTRGRPDASGYQLPDDSLNQFNFMFELCTKDNRVVVCHPAPRIVLHGIRDIPSSEEVPIDVLAAECGFPTVKTYPLTTLEDCVRTAAEFKGHEHEGFVVVDAQFRRLKLKNPAYVAMAHMAEGMSFRRMLDLIRMGESTEFLTHFPEWQKDYDMVKEKFDAVEAEIATAWDAHKHLFGKDFAVTLKGHPWHATLCSMMRGHFTSPKHALAEISLEKLGAAVGLKQGVFVSGEAA